MKIILTYIMFLISLQVAQGQSNFHEGEISPCSEDSTRWRHTPNLGIDTSNIGMIKLVSFKSGWLLYNDRFYSPRAHACLIPNGDRLKEKRIRNFKIDELRLDSRWIHEMETIEKDSIMESVLSTLNAGYTGDTITSGKSLLCYYPRNAIVLYDKHNRINTIIELCFQCRNYCIVSQDKSSIGLCTGTIDSLFEIFKSAGINYGTVNSKIYMR